MKSKEEGGRGETRKVKSVREEIRKKSRVEVEKPERRRGRGCVLQCQGGFFFSRWRGLLSGTHSIVSLRLESSVQRAAHRHRRSSIYSVD